MNITYLLIINIVKSLVGKIPWVSLKLINPEFKIWNDLPFILPLFPQYSSWWTFEIKAKEKFVGLFIVF